MPTLHQSRWPDTDLASVGLTPDRADLSDLTLVDLAQGLGVCHNGQSYLDWESFRYALAIFERVEDDFAPEQLAALAHALIDLQVQAVLHIQSGMQCTQYAADRLLEDALAARDRLPRCAELIRIGRLDRRRFHKLVVETELVSDPALLAQIDATIAAHLLSLGSATAMSEKGVAGLGRRHVAEIDPEAAQRARENAKKGRTVTTQDLPYGMARLTVVAPAEDIELARRSVDAIIAGLCPNDPRTKAQARADAVTALLGAGPAFACQCDRDDCTATLDQVEIDARTARIVIHVLCQEGTLDDDTEAEARAKDNADAEAGAGSSGVASRDQCGYLDGYGPISGEHVRELARRDDSVVTRHNLDSLCSELPVPPERLPSRPDTPDPCRGDDPRPEPENLAEPADQTDDPAAIPDDLADMPDDFADMPDDFVEVPDDPGEVFDWEPPPDWFIDYSVDPDEEPADPSDGPEGFPTDPAGTDALLERLAAADGGRDYWEANVDAMVALLDSPPAPAPAPSPAPEVTPTPAAEPAPATAPAPTPVPDAAPAPEPVAVISRTSLPSDPYRPNAVLEVIVRFLWGTCAVDGCHRAAYRCDLDHVDEFNHFIPSQGGPTCLCNLVPRCRFHHLIKTCVTGVVDDLWRGEDGRYRTSLTLPGGLTTITVAPNHWLLPQLNLLRCLHQVDADVRADGPQHRSSKTGPVAPEDGPQRARTRTEAKHAARRAARARNRRELDADAADAAAFFDILKTIDQINDRQQKLREAHDRLEDLPF